MIDALLDTLDADEALPRRRRDDWVERDRAMLLTALLAGLRLEELVGINSVTSVSWATARWFTCAAKAAKTGACPSKPHSSVTLRSTWPAGVPGFRERAARALPHRGTGQLAG